MRTTLCATSAGNIVATALRGLSPTQQCKQPVHMYMGMDSMSRAARVLYALLPSMRAKHTPCLSIRGG